MPDNKETGEQLSQTLGDFQPGELAPYDYSPEPNAELSKDAEKSLQLICRDAARRDVAARRMEVEQSWEARLFGRGYQHLLKRRQGGWDLPNETTGFGPAAQSSFAEFYETNIYGAHGDILVSALVRDIPACRFEPFDPNYAPDVTAAAKANEYKDIFARNNDLKKVHTQLANYLYTDGRALLYTRYVLDGQRFGFEDPQDDNPVAPETMGEQRSEDGAPKSEAQELTQEMNQSPSGGRKPRGREVVDVFGKLEHKVPIKTNDIHEMMAVQLFREVDVAIAKAMFPALADKIKAGGTGIAEVELDRIARINSQLALQASYVTGDSLNKDVTLAYNWLRPSAFMDAECTDTVKQELLEAFPDGALVVYAGQQYAFARNESMDDHLTIVQSSPGNGQNRAAMGSKLIPIQKRLNDWLDLQHDFFVNTVPQKWLDADTFDIEAISKQPNLPGGIHGFQRVPGVPVEELIFVEPSPQPQPSMAAFIDKFFNEFPEMLSGALPSLFGAESNTDTVGGISIQRDQALGRLAAPWGAMQSAVATYFRQAVMCAAECREGQISQIIPGKGPVTVNVEDLKGNVLCYPTQDNNFPETWIQKSSRLQMLMTEGQNNPLIMKLMSVPKNMKLVKDAIGLTDLEVPEAASVDKQLGEFEVLLKTGPVTNPQLVQGQQQFEQSMEQAKAEGPQAASMFLQMAPKVIESLKQLPPEVSTVTIDYEVDDHSTEAETCREWLNSPEGRKFKNGTPEERAAYANVRLHFIEHSQAAAKKAKENAPSPQSKVTMAANVKDLPAPEAAALLQKAGIDAKPEDFMNSEAADTQKQIAIKNAEPSARKAPTNGSINEEVHSQLPN